MIWTDNFSNFCDFSKTSANIFLFVIDTFLVRLILIEELTGLLN